MLHPIYIERFEEPVAPKGVPVLVQGGVAKKNTGGEWVSLLTGRPLQWTPTWWAHLPTVAESAPDNHPST